MALRFYAAHRALTYTPWGYIITTAGHGNHNRYPSRLNRKGTTAMATTMEKTCCAERDAQGASHRTKARTEEERTKLIHRLNRIEGQIRGIRGMVERDVYCNDILIQSAAVNAAINAFSRDLIACHIRTCVAEDIRAGNDGTIEELIATLQKLMK